MVIPVHDINPTRRRPVVTYALVVANVIVFLLSPVPWGWIDGMTVADICAQQNFYQQWGAVPRELLTNDPLPAVAGGPAQDAQGNVGCFLVPPDFDKNPLLSVFTSMFLHGGWLHLLGNMLYLFVFGNNVEDRMGRVRFLLFYLAAGAVAAYGYALVNAGSTTTLVGASGAIAGVLGAYLMIFPRARVWSLVPFFFFIPLRLPAWLVLGLWFVLQWFYSVGTGVTGGADVAYLAHVIGFVVGVLVGLLVGKPRQPPNQPLPYGYPWSPYRR